MVWRRLRRGTQAKRFFSASLSGGRGGGGFRRWRRWRPRGDEETTRGGDELFRWWRFLLCRVRAGSILFWDRGTRRDAAANWEVGAWGLFWRPRPCGLSGLWRFPAWT